MIVVYNRIGIVMFTIPLVLCCLIAVSLPEGSELKMVPVWGGVMFVWDIVYRIVYAGKRGLLPQYGGHVWFIPVWVYGAAVLGWWVHHLTAAKPGM